MNPPNKEATYCLILKSIFDLTNDQVESRPQNALQKKLDTIDCLILVVQPAIKQENKLKLLERGLRSETKQKYKKCGTK